MVRGVDTLDITDRRTSGDNDGEVEEENKAIKITIPLNFSIDNNMTKNTDHKSHSAASQWSEKHTCSNKPNNWATMPNTKSCNDFQFSINIPQANKKTCVSLFL